MTVIIPLHCKQNCFFTALPLNQGGSDNSNKPSNFVSWGKLTVVKYLKSKLTRVNIMKYIDSWGIHLTTFYDHNHSPKHVRRKVCRCQAFPSNQGRSDCSDKPSNFLSQGKLTVVKYLRSKFTRVNIMKYIDSWGIHVETFYYRNHSPKHVRRRVCHCQALPSNQGGSNCTDKPMRLQHQSINKSLVEFIALVPGMTFVVIVVKFFYWLPT